MSNLNEKYFTISERRGRNHQNKFCLRPLKGRFSPWELNYCVGEIVGGKSPISISIGPTGHHLYPVHYSGKPLGSMEPCLNLVRKQMI